jgi:hypothetical protein
MRSHSAKDISSPIIHIGVGKGLALLAIGYLAIGLPLVHPFHISSSLYDGDRFTVVDPQGGMR